MLPKLAAFLIAKQAAGLSPRTLEWYRQQIGVYVVWLQSAQAGDTWEQPATVERYLAGQRLLPLRPTTIAARHRSLSIWFAWLVRRKLLPASPVAEIPKPKVPKVVVRHVTIVEFRRLYQSVPEGGPGVYWHDWRDRVLLLLLYWSGLRVSELVGLQLGDVDTAAQLVTVRRGKGGKDRIIPCVPEIRRELLAYLMARPAWAGAEIFLSNDGYGGVRGPLTAEGVRQMLRRRCRLAQLRHMNPHSFRHGFAMAMLNSGMQMSAVADVMGHSSEQVTASIYARWLTAGLSREYHQARARLEQTWPSTHNE